jgi:radical SAM superfamily enzyme YgiQ (UPF0313 family)
MRVLLVYPQYPDTFWSFKHALKFVSKKAAFPPLGLLTIAAMLPREWDKKVIDLNVTNLSDRDIEWADYVFISAMAVQKDSVKNVIKRCRKLETKIVAGGPLFTTGYEEFDEVAHFVLNEAEITLPLFLEDLRNGQAKHVYTSDKWADVKETPLPEWELIDVKKYSAMSIQYSRGCPFDCEFCDIVVLNGHTPRTKGADQLLKELDEFYNRGWRSSVFIVDDNFIGNKKKLKAEILPAIIEWMKKRKKPFSLFTEASINLADDEELVRLMVKANFNMVFIGIETTNEDSLAECSKLQNRNRDMVASVRKLQNYGLQVQGGFILGFDNDPPAIFENMISFIQKSGIVTAMVGLLNAPRGTRLYRRLKKEKRLLSDFTGDNTDCTMNFVPRMEYKSLMNGYKKVIDTIYAPKQYYERVKTFLKEYKPKGAKVFSLEFEQVKAFVKSVWFLGIIGRGRQYYWRLLAWTLTRRPKAFSLSVVLAIYGFHFRKVVEGYIKTLARDSRSRA